jgi:hypothetical protein
MPNLFAARFARDELLFRARAAEELSRLRPTVLILDASPAVIEPLASVLKPAAHIIAATLIKAGVDVALLIADGTSRPRPLAKLADLIDLWTAHIQGPAAENDTLRIAPRSLLQFSATSPLPPIPIVLSHEYFGADQDLPRVAGLRRVLARFPRRRGSAAAAATSPASDGLQRDTFYLVPDANIETLPRLLATLFVDPA